MSQTTHWWRLLIAFLFSNSFRWHVSVTALSMIVADSGHVRNLQTGTGTGTLTHTRAGHGHGETEHRGAGRWSQQATPRPKCIEKDHSTTTKNTKTGRVGEKGRSEQNFISSCCACSHLMARANLFTYTMYSSAVQTTTRHIRAALPIPDVITDSHMHGTCAGIKYKTHMMAEATWGPLCVCAAIHQDIVRMLWILCFAEHKFCSSNWKMVHLVILRASWCWCTDVCWCQFVFYWMRFWRGFTSSCVFVELRDCYWKISILFKFSVSSATHQTTKWTIHWAKIKVHFVRDYRTNRKPSIAIAINRNFSSASPALNSVVEIVFPVCVCVWVLSATLETV